MFLRISRGGGNFCKGPRTLSRGRTLSPGGRFRNFCQSLYSPFAICFYAAIRRLQRIFGSSSNPSQRSKTVSFPWVRPRHYMTALAIVMVVSILLLLRQHKEVVASKIHPIHLNAQSQTSLQPASFLPMAEQDNFLGPSKIPSSAKTDRTKGSQIHCLNTLRTSRNSVNLRLLPQAESHFQWKLSS